MKYIRGNRIDPFDVAKDFVESYKRCLHEDKNHHHVSIPGFVNGFFACELFMKLLCKENIYDHDLSVIFNHLNSEEQKKLVDRFDIKTNDNLTFEEFLKKVSNGFGFWRYVFEPKNKEFEDLFPFEYSEKFLQKYLPILEKMAKEHNNASSEN